MFRWVVVDSSSIEEVVATGGGGQCSREQYEAVAEAMSAGGGAVVFGCGFDSGLWLDAADEAVFLESDPAWAAKTLARYPEADVRPVSYRTRMPFWRRQIEEGGDLFLSECEPLLFRGWGVVFVDAPTGHSMDCPGRLQSIYTASRLKVATVFVHDYDRNLEREAFLRFFGEPDDVLKGPNNWMAVKHIRAWC